MSSSSSYSSPSTSSVGLQAQSNFKTIHHHSTHHHPNPRTTHSILPSHQSSLALSNDPAFRRKLGLPYSSRHPRNTTKPTSCSSPSRSLITVLPPDSLSSSTTTQHRSSTFSSTDGSSSRLSKGILIPLYSTLAAQLAAISREYGLPSTAGMILYLIEGSSHTGELANQLVGGPRISEEAWQILWSGVFEDEREEALQNDLRTKELYDDQDLDLQLPLANRRTSCLGFNQSAEEEEVLNGGLEELINSGLNFPNPPLNSRQAYTAHLNLSSQEDLSNSSATLSTQPSPISSYSSSCTSDDILKLNTKNNSHASSALACMAHDRSLSSSPHESNPHRTTRLQSADFPPRPSTSLSAQMPRHPSSRRADPSLNHYGVSSNRGSLYSLAPRPRRIGAGTIVGKIEFDIDRSKSCGRWFDLWLNPPSLRCQNPSVTNFASDDHSRPLLLPNLITQRNKSSTFLQDPQKQGPISSDLIDSPQLTNLSGSTPSHNKSHSFIAFDDNIHHVDSHSGFQSSNPEPVLYSNQHPGGKEETSHGFFTSQLNPVKKSISPMTAIGEKRQFGNRIVNEQHRQAMAMVAAQAKHQALVDQIDAQLSSPIGLDYPQNHSYGLSLGVDSHLEFADIRYTPSEDEFEYTFSSIPPTGMTAQSSSMNLSSQSEVPDNQRLMFDHASDKRTSSMAIKNNLDELEQALASLSPKALRFSPAHSSSHLPSVPLSVTSMDNAIPTDINHTSGRLSGCSELTANGSSVQRSQPSPVSPYEEKSGAKPFQFESLQESFTDLKHGSSPQDVTVGLTEGYMREDVREHKAPFSPAVVKRSFSPSIKSMIRPNTPSAKKIGDGFVTKAAGIMTGKFRISGTK